MLIRLVTAELASEFSWQGNKGKRILQDLTIFKLMHSKYQANNYYIICHFEKMAEVYQIVESMFCFFEKVNAVSYLTFLYLR